MVISGYTKGELKGAFVYFIFAKDLLYIGDTQKVAFARWYSHLYENGTLIKKIQKQGKNPSDYLNYLNFISISCTEILVDFPEIKWKTITHAVEDSVHKLLYKSQKALIESYYQKYEPAVNRFTIISDTSRTAPKRLPISELNYADDYALRIINEVCCFL